MYKFRLAIIALVMIIGTATVIFASQTPHDPRGTEDSDYYIDGLLLSNFVEDAQRTLLSERPYHKGQLNIEDIAVGQILDSVHKVGTFEILVMHEPYMKDGDCKYDYIWLEPGTKWEEAYLQSGFCADSGLIAYTGEFQGWNQNNYLKESGKIPFSLEQVQKIIMDLDGNQRMELNQYSEQDL